MIFISAFDITGTYNGSAILQGLQQLQNALNGIKAPTIAPKLEIPNISSSIGQLKSQFSSANFGDVLGGFKTQLMGGVGNFGEVGKNLGNALSNGVSSGLSQFGMIGNVAGEVVTALGPAGIALAGVAVGVTALGAASVGAASEWQSLMTGVAKTTGLQGTDLSNLSKELINISTQSPIAASELASIAAVAGSLGVQKDQISGFAQTASQMAIGFEMPAEVAATSSAKILTAFGQPINTKNMEALGNVVNSMGDNYAATESQVLDFTNRASFLNTTFGMSIPQVAAWGTTLISSGMEAETASTGIKSLMNMSMDPKKFENFAAVAGMSSEELRQSLNEDVMGTYSKVADKIAGGTDAVEKFQTVSKLVGAEGMTAFMKMAGKAGDLKDATKLATDQQEAALSGKGGGSLEKTYDAQAATLKSQMQMLSNSANAIMVDVGTPLLAPISAGVGAVTTGLNAARGAGEALVGTFTNTSAFAQLESIGSTISSSIGSSIGIISGSISQIGTSLNSAFGGDALGSFAEIITTPLSMSLGLVNQLIGLLGTMGNAAATGIGATLTAVASAITMISSGLKTASAYLQAFGEVTGITDAFNSAKKSIDDIIEKVSEIGSKISSGLTTAIPTAINGLQGALASLASQFGALLTTSITGPLAGVADAMGLSGVSSKLNEISTRANEILKPAITDAVGDGALSGATDAAPKVADALTSDIASATAKAFDDAQTAYIKAHPGGMSLINGQIVGGADHTSDYSNRLSSGKYSTFANGDVAWDLFAAAESGKSGILTATIDLDGTSYTREFSTLEDTAESAAKKIKAEFRDVFTDLPRYLEKTGPELSDSLSSILSDGIISFEEKGELEKYLKTLDQIEIISPLRFDVLGLEDVRKQVQDSLKGIDVQPDLTKYSYGLWLSEQSGVQESVYNTTKKILTDTSEKPVWELLKSSTSEVNAAYKLIDTALTSDKVGDWENAFYAVNLLAELKPELLGQESTMMKLEAVTQKYGGTVVQTSDGFRIINSSGEELAGSHLRVSVADDILSGSMMETATACKNAATMYNESAALLASSSRLSASYPALYSTSGSYQGGYSSLGNVGLSATSTPFDVSSVKWLKYLTKLATGGKVTKGGLAWVGENETEYVIPESQIKGLYPESPTVEKGSMRYLLESVPMRDYPYTIQKPTGYQYSHWPDAPNVDGSGNVPIAWLSDDQTSGMDYISSEIRKIQLDAIKTGAGSVVPYWLKGEVKQPDWWVQKATELSPKYAANWAESKGGTAPQIVADSSESAKQDRITVRDAYFKTYGDSFCIDPVEPDASLNYIPSASYIASLGKKDAESTRAAIEYLYGENFTEGCLATNPISEGVFNPSNRLLEEVARANGGAWGSQIVGGTSSTTSDRSLSSDIRAIRDNTKDSKQATEGLLASVDKASLQNAVSGISNGAKTVSVAANPSDALIGLSKEGYVVSYDPRTDTCEGLSFNAPDPSLKTTDKFYLGLTKDNPAYKSYDEYGWEGKTGWTDNPNLDQLQKINEENYKESQKTTESSEQTAENTQDVYRTLGQQYALQQKALTLSGATLDATGALVSLVSGTSGGLYGSTSGSFWGGLSIGGGGGSIGTGASLTGWGAQASNSIIGNTGTVGIGQGALYYENGGLADSPEYFMNDGQLAVRGEAGPELILPLSDPARVAELLRRYLPGVHKFATGGLVGSSGVLQNLSAAIGPTSITYAPVINGAGLSEAALQRVLEKERKKIFAEVSKKQVLAARRRS